MSKYETENKLIFNCHQGDSASRDELLQIIYSQYMRKRIGRYFNKNRQVENDDLIQEFLIGVNAGIDKADLLIGEPFEYVLKSGVYRVISYMRKHIISNTEQICKDCGKRGRINKVGSGYQCKQCGSTSIETVELYEYDETKILSIEDPTCIELDASEDDFVDRFESTLTPGTNIHDLFILMVKEEINPANPEVVNYIKEISRIWGGCSSQNVMKSVHKLRDKLLIFLHENGYEYYVKIYEKENK